MTPPLEFQQATIQFYQFLTDAREAAGLETTNQSYTMAQGVLQAFRRRLELKEAIRFLVVLPAGVRALFTADWDPDEPKRPFGDRAAMTKEVQALRPLHNFAPENSIQAVAIALRRNIDPQALDRILGSLPVGAKEFWKPEGFEA